MRDSLLCQGGATGVRRVYEIHHRDNVHSKGSKFDNDEILVICQGRYAFVRNFGARCVFTATEPTGMSGSK